MCGCHICDCQIKRSPPGASSCIDISTRGQEHFDAIGSTLACCKVQRCGTTAVCRIHIHAGLNQQRHQLDTCTVSRKVKWSVPCVIGGRFQICPRVAKELEAGRTITLILLIIT